MVLLKSNEMASPAGVHFGARSGKKLLRYVRWRDKDSKIMKWGYIDRHAALLPRWLLQSIN